MAQGDFGAHPARLRKRPWRVIFTTSIKARKTGVLSAWNGLANQGKVNEINRNLTILANSGNYVFTVLAVI
ncbi:hypothetical protein G6L58_07150 [Agrobacterium tumefaciens]|uniref:hypothetical protein n=1 Tax=Agrobacterium tumefaciens TaxID=358 RepID=UPI0013CE552B|nr:hypothetical protein [Agrobacterium tumefaciens]